MIEDFHDSNDKWLVLLLDFGYENFVMTSEGQLKVVNLGGMVIVDKDQTSTSESDFSSHFKQEFDASGRYTTGKLTWAIYDVDSLTSL